jgi:hypothetical protein
MVDLIELTRSVVRIPVAGPSPNNTLVFVRGTFAGSTKQQANHRIYREKTLGVTAYQIDGFQQSRANDYIANTRWSVTGSIAYLSSDNDQDFVAAVDAIEGHLDSNGTFYVTADVATMIDDNILGLSFSLSCYILTQEPQPDFTRPPRRFVPVGERVKLGPSWSQQAHARPVSKEEEAKLLATLKVRRIIDDTCS